MTNSLTDREMEVVKAEEVEEAEEIGKYCIIKALFHTP